MLRKKIIFKVRFVRRTARFTLKIFYSAVEFCQRHGVKSSYQLLHVSRFGSGLERIVPVEIVSVICRACNICTSVYVFFRYQYEKYILQEFGNLHLFRIYGIVFFQVYFTRLSVPCLYIAQIGRIVCYQFRNGHASRLACLAHLCFELRLSLCRKSCQEIV